jgi:hypothetical protein
LAIVEPILYISEQGDSCIGQNIRAAVRRRRVDRGRRADRDEKLTGTTSGLKTRKEKDCKHEYGVNTGGGGGVEDEDFPKQFRASTALTFDITRINICRKNIIKSMDVKDCLYNTCVKF